MEILFIKTLPPEHLRNLFLNGPDLVFILFLVLAQFLCRYQPVPVILIKAALVCTDAFFLFLQPPDFFPVHIKLVDVFLPAVQVLHQPHRVNAECHVLMDYVKYRLFRFLHLQFLPGANPVMGFLFPPPAALIPEQGPLPVMPF